MLSLNQKTINGIIKLNGIGLHNGVRADLTIKPADDNFGIKFCRSDLDSKDYISANYKNVVEPILCTKIKNKNGITVSTVEHLMAAFFGEGIDNALVEVSASEIPILDGSANEFVDAIRKVGTKEQTTPRQFLKVKKKVEVFEKEKFISIEPADNDLIIDFEIVYNNPLIRTRRKEFKLSENNLNDIYNSRTFCLYEDIDYIKSKGLAKGGSLENAVVVNDDRVLNEGGLRNDKEFVNHKILDLAGDFLLSGHRVIGKVVCHQGGHELTNLFLREIFNSKLSFETIEFADYEVSKKSHNKQLEKLAVNA